MFFDSRSVLENLWLRLSYFKAVEYVGVGVLTVVDSVDGIGQLLMLVSLGLNGAHFF